VAGAAGEAEAAEETGAADEVDAAEVAGAAEEVGWLGFAGRFCWAAPVLAGWAFTG
jgi:hypothetical protein